MACRMQHFLLCIVDVCIISAVFFFVLHIYTIYGIYGIHNSTQITHTDREQRPKTIQMEYVIRKV
jgi:hypothetical protein